MPVAEFLRGWTELDTPTESGSLQYNLPLTGGIMEGSSSRCGRQKEAVMAEGKTGR